MGAAVRESAHSAAGGLGSLKKPTPGPQKKKPYRKDKAKTQAAVYVTYAVQIYSRVVRRCVLSYKARHHGAIMTLTV